MSWRYSIEKYNSSASIRAHTWRFMVDGNCYVEVIHYRGRAYDIHDVFGSKAIFTKGYSFRSHSLVPFLAYETCHSTLEDAFQRANVLIERLITNVRSFASLLPLSPPPLPILSSEEEDEAYEAETLHS